jgi:flagellar hook-associated protein 3 FlgL
MRVNPNLTTDILSAIWRAQGQEQTALLQLSTQKRVNTPSDDPLAAAEMVANQDDSSRADQYLQNIDTLTMQVQSADTALSSVVQALNQTITLGVQGATGTVSASQMQEIALSVQGIQAQILGFANASVSGRYLFGGTDSTTTPFALGASSVTYNGNGGTNVVSIADGVNVQVNLPGDQVFQNPGGDVFGSLQQLIAALQAGDKAATASATTQLRSALDQVSGQREFYGSTLNQLTSTQTFLQQEKVSLASQQNSLVGVDMATAATALTQAQTAYNAVLAAAARILPTSLLDYLK